MRAPSHFGLGGAALARVGSRRRTLVLASLDIIAIACAIVAVAGDTDADVMLHIVWVVLAIEAFAFGLRATLIRITVATFAVIVVAETGGRTHPFESFAQLAFSEWPLMVVISLIVAVMADRVATTSRRYATLYREASDRLLDAQEIERYRLARDLHDGVGQTLSALAYTLDAADSAMWAGSAAPDLTRTALRRAQELGGIALEETRGVAFRLRPARITETGLAASLNELARSCGLPVRALIDPDLMGRPVFSPDVDIELYRVAQEALANAGRHAGASQIWLSLQRTGSDVIMEIADDGVGFDTRASRTQSLGLAGMAERAASAAAELTIDSTFGRGTRVRVVTPIVDPGDATVPAAAIAAAHS